MEKTHSSSFWPVCDRLLATQIEARALKHAAMQRAEERTRARLKTLDFVDTQPACFRSEAFAEDLQDLRPPAAPVGLGRALMRGLAAVAAGRPLA
jgi:hypothetical protein